MNITGVSGTNITDKDIKTAIVKLLQKNGFEVVASEIKEGFPKPAVFIDVFPESVSRHGALLEQIILSIELKYVPNTETSEHIMDISNKFKEIFMYQPLKVHDRRFTIENIDFENYVLFTYFDISFLQELPQNEEFEPIENLEMDGDI